VLRSGGEANQRTRSKQLAPKQHRHRIHAPTVQKAAKEKARARLASKGCYDLPDLRTRINTGLGDDSGQWGGGADPFRREGDENQHRRGGKEEIKVAMKTPEGARPERVSGFEKKPYDLTSDSAYVNCKKGTKVRHQSVNAVNTKGARVRLRCQ